MVTATPEATAAPAGVFKILIFLKNYLVLPAEVTDFERDYVSRINKIALAFFWAHLPVMMGVAWACGTGPLWALLLTSLLLIGPTVASRVMESPRRLSLVMGFTSMCMGGLLVHFGQGPMQIEMHFYFFVLLALLAVYGNPLSILTATVTVALHHLLLYFLLPSSVFNYDASIWVVLVHALFVVLESVAACFVARSFFDDVIGLEKVIRARTAALDQRNEDMRLVLEHVEQGLLTLDRHGLISRERSAALEQWLGPAPEGDVSFSDYLAGVAPEAAAWFEVGWDALWEGFLPRELALEQLPRQVKVRALTLRLDYTPIFGAGGALERVLLVISDVTPQIAREQVEARQREVVQVFHRVMADKQGFLEFFEEASELVEAIQRWELGHDLALLKRQLHTLKGNAGIFGLAALAHTCHEVENYMEEVCDGPLPEHCHEIAEHWASLRESLRGLLGERQQHQIEIEDAQYEAILRATLEGAPRAELAAMIRAWRLEPTRVRLQRIEQQARQIARRLNKPHVQVEALDHGLRMDPKRWAPFWSAFVHAIRNALDHGLEPLEERLAAGKAGEASLKLETRMDDESFVVEIADDGRGIDWEKVAQKARQAGLPHQTREELEWALFTDGVSTRDEASMFSGRGVGMGAILQATRALGGEVHIDSNAQAGTRLWFSFPKEALAG
jgi:two-component system chemotaxis sensor kinase CheA